MATTAKQVLTLMGQSRAALEEKAARAEESAQVAARGNDPKAENYYRGQANGLRTAIAELGTIELWSVSR